MAAAAVSSPVISLNTHATFPLRLGSSILKSTESTKFTSVRYNHKPRLDNETTAKCSISPSRESDGLELDLKAGNKEYAYHGRNVGDGDRYVLLAKGSGKDAEMVLERLEACREFNLVRTPEEESIQALEERYTQLPDDEEGEDDLFGSDNVGEDEPPDAENPFDYRNYLKSTSNKAKAGTAEAPRSGASTPLKQPRPASITPHSRPSKRSEGPLIAQKKRKAQDTAKINPKRVKAGTEPNTPQPTAAPVRKDIPKVRMDRKASLQLAPFDDMGELIVENETPVQEKPRSAMALALTGQLGQGPISLHSAASSPASRVASPIPPRPEHFEEGLEFELGERSSPEATKKHRTGDERGVSGENEDANADVEDLELPSPAQTRRQPRETVEDVVQEKMGADDEDDLDKQLALAMAEEDEGEAPPPAAPVESDEESEEE